jgi:hypothetical protein
VRASLTGEETSCYLFILVVCFRGWKSWIAGWDMGFWFVCWFVGTKIKGMGG